jgi:hypothetical protein
MSGYGFQAARGRLLRQNRATSPRFGSLWIEYRRQCQACPPSCIQRIADAPPSTACSVAASLRYSSPCHAVDSVPRLYSALTLPLRRIEDADTNAAAERASPLLPLVKSEHGGFPHPHQRQTLCSRNKRPTNTTRRKLSLGLQRQQQSGRSVPSQRPTRMARGGGITTRALTSPPTKDIEVGTTCPRVRIL